MAKKIEQIIEQADKLIKQEKYGDAWKLLLPHKETPAARKRLKWLKAKQEQLKLEKEIGQSPATKQESGWQKRLRRYGIASLLSCAFVCAFLMFIASMGNDDSLPTEVAIEQLSTSEPIETTLEAEIVDTFDTEQPTDTFTDTPVPTDTAIPTATYTTVPTNTITPSPTITRTPLPTATDVISPTAITAFVVQTLDRSQLNQTELALLSILDNMTGLDIVQLISFIQSENYTGFYVEAIVYEGYNTLDIPETLLQAAIDRTGIQNIDTQIILSDGIQAISYNQNEFTDGWQQTLLNSVQPPTPRPITESQTIQPTLAPANNQYNVQPISSRTMYAQGSVRVRECPSSPDCTVMGELTDGQAVTITGQANGSLYQGSTLWYQLDTGYFAHSELLTGSAPAPQIQTNITNQSTVQNQSYTCNCSKTCPNMTCQEAQYQLNYCGCTARDSDGDGLACDSQCG